MTHYDINSSTRTPNPEVFLDDPVLDFLRGQLQPISESIEFSSEFGIVLPDGLSRDQFSMIIARGRKMGRKFSYYVNFLEADAALKMVKDLEDDQKREAIEGAFGPDSFNRVEKLMTVARKWPVGLRCGRACWSYHRDNTNLTDAQRGYLSRKWHRGHLIEKADLDSYLASIGQAKRKLVNVGYLIVLAQEINERRPGHAERHLELRRLEIKNEDAAASRARAEAGKTSFPLREESNGNDNADATSHFTRGNEANCEDILPEQERRSDVEYPDDDELDAVAA